MSRTDNDFITSHNWTGEKTISANEVLNDICGICGFNGHSMSGGVLGGLQFIAFTQSDVSEKTCGELLDIISESMAGVWVCLGETLHLVCLGATDGTVVQCENHTEIEYQGRTQIIGLVMKNSSTGQTFSYGTSDGSGYVIQVENGIISSELAGVVWQRIKDYTYTAWNCQKADITTRNFGFGGLLQFAFGGNSESLKSPLFPRMVNYSVDNTGIYFSGGCDSIDEWNYKSKLEREKIGIGKAVGSVCISENGRINYVIKK